MKFKEKFKQIEELTELPKSENTVTIYFLIFKGNFDLKGKSFQIALSIDSTWLKSCSAMASPKFWFGGGHSPKTYSLKTFEMFWKIYKKLAQKFTKFSKLFQK